MQKYSLNIAFMTLPYDSDSFVRAVLLPRNWNNHKQLPLSTFLHEICSSKLMQPKIYRKTNVLTVLSDGAISVGCKRKHMVNVDYFKQRFDTGFRMVIGSEISSTSVGSKLIATSGALFLIIELNYLHYFIFLLKLPWKKLC